MKHKAVDQTTSLLTVRTLIKELSSCYDNIFKGFKVSRFIWNSFFDQFWIHLTWYFNDFSRDQCNQNNVISFIKIQRY